MAKKHWVAIILISLLASSSWAATPVPSLMATPPQPAWSELSVPQKIILAPLSDDWDSLESYRQKKWLGIAERFASMSPLEQRRIQSQMQVWGKLTPEQRELARKNFLTAKQLPEEEKQALRQKWREYSNLSPEEKIALISTPANTSFPQRPAPPAGVVPPSPAGLNSDRKTALPGFIPRLSQRIFPGRISAEDLPAE